MKKKKILIIEPDDLTGLLLAKEVEQTNNRPILVRDIEEGYCAVVRENISLIICDNDIFEGAIFAECLSKFRYDVPLITTSTFLHNQKFVSKNSVVTSLKKPVDWDGYKILRGCLKEIV